MIFFILNIFCAAAVFGLAVMMDFAADDNKTRYFTNMLLLQAFSALVAALCVLFMLFDHKGLLSSFARFFIWFPAVQSSTLFLWCCRFPSSKNSVPWRFFLLVVLALSFYFVFFLVDSISLNENKSISVVSKFIGVSSIDWYTVYKILLVYVFPVLTILVLFFKYELASRRILRQQVLLFAAALVVGQMFFFLIYRASKVSGQYLFIMMLPFVYGLILFLFYIIQRNVVLFMGAVFFRSAISFLLTYVFPSLCTGVVFSLLLPLAKSSKPLFLLLTSSSAVFLFVLAHFVRDRLSGFEWYSSSLYAQRIETEFASLDFGDIDTQIDIRFARILQKNLNTVDVTVLTENDEHKLVTRYSLTGKQVEFDLNNSVFTALLNIQRRVIFKSHCDSVHELSPFASKLYALFEQTDSAVMILLNEGAHLFGMVLLGEKKLEQSYTDYDYETFNSLYSRFFLIGYYLKNIANEEIVGLVGREIRFSSQVIQSLRKKTDIPSHDNCDADSFSLSARSLGSGFTDFIKLDANRYITVIGDLSGKGLNASMLMAILKTMIPIFLAETEDFKNLVQKVNLFIRENLPRGTFFAGMFCIMDMQSRILYYANCALAAMFMYNKAYNNMIEIQGEGKVLGFVEDISSLIKVKRIQLASGDMLVGVTNGLIETKSLRGDRFGKNRIQRIVLDNIKQPAGKICALLSSAVKEFADKELEEDASAVVIKMA